MDEGKIVMSFARNPRNISKTNTFHVHFKGLDEPVLREDEREGFEGRRFQGRCRNDRGRKRGGG